MLLPSAMIYSLKGLYFKGLDIMIYDYKMITTYVLKDQKTFRFLFQVLIRYPWKARAEKQREVRRKQKNVLVGGAIKAWMVQESNYLLIQGIFYLCG